MTSLTCREAEELLDLYAAEACEPSQAEAVSTHLATCAACSASLEEARRLLALLDWQAREPQALQRLHSRIETEARRSRVRAGQPAPWLRQLGALAALLLVTVGLVGWLGRGVVPGVAAPEETVIAALTLSPSDRGQQAERMIPQPAKEMRVTIGLEAKLADRDSEGSVTVRIRGLTPPARLFREGPPPVDLAIAVRNDGDRPLTVLLEKRTLPQLDLTGPGVRRVPLAEAPPSVLSPPMLRLGPERTGRLVLHRLVSGPPERPTALYVTQPGEYVLTVRLRVEVVWEATPGKPERRGEVWLSVPPVRLWVPAE